MRETIKQILIRRDGMFESDADDLIAEAKDQLEDYLFNNDFEAAENICADYFGLEPDFLDELMSLG